MSSKFIRVKLIHHSPTQLEREMIRVRVFPNFESEDLSSHRRLILKAPLEPSEEATIQTKGTKAFMKRPFCDISKNNIAGYVPYVRERSRIMR